MTIGERVKNARLKKGLTQEELAHKLGYKSRSSVNKIELERDIPRSMIVKIAEILDVTPAYLMGWEETQDDGHKPNAQLLPSDSIRMVPCFESVSAGFGASAQNHIIEYIPIYIESDQEAAETICVRVRGDSMHPRIEDGDIVQVHKQGQKGKNHKSPIAEKLILFLFHAVTASVACGDPHNYRRDPPTG